MPCLSRIAGVREIMALPWSFVSKITNSKHQITNKPVCHTRHERAGLKLQYSMTQTFQDETLFGFSNFGHWTLFDICNLIFVILIIQ